MADVDFTKVNGDVDQYNAAGTLKGDFDTMVFTLGFKGKYTFKLSALDIAPHAGIRYSYYDIGSDNIKYGKEELKNKSLDAKVLYLPVGVAFSKDVKVDNWSIRSVCDLELIAATGDTDVTSKVVASGVELSAKSDVVDKFSYSGKLGVNFENGNFGLGLGYRYLGSKNVNNHNVYLTARYTSKDKVHT